MENNNSDTLSKAMATLREKGYVKDLTEEILNAPEGNYFITEVFRFEGMSNPDDSSVLYAIESKDGDKGIIIDAYAVNDDSRKTEALRKLRKKNT